MHRRRFLLTSLAGVLAAPLAAEAQQTGKVYRVGFLRFGSTPPAFIEGFRQGLRELGYVEGQNIVIEYGLPQSAAQLPDVAAGLVRRKVDVLVASGVPSVLPAKNATSVIPVVFVSAIHPVATGVVASLGRPGGNVTGVTVADAHVWSSGARATAGSSYAGQVTSLALSGEAVADLRAIGREEIVDATPVYRVGGLPWPRKPASQSSEERPAKLATITPSSAGSTGFGTCILYPAESERNRSSTLPNAVRASAGVLPPWVKSRARTFRMSV